MSKVKVAILYGGKSVEHKISLNSARNILEHIDKDKFEPFTIGISEQGDWYLTDGITSEFDELTPLHFKLSNSSPTFVAGDQEYTADIIFPVLHGTDGEDGSIQGFLQAFDLPFAGSGVLGSAVSMSKLYSKRLLQAAGIPTSRFISVSSSERDQLTYEHVSSQLGLPFMAKAANLGSSVGVSKVKSESDFAQAVEEGFKYDSLMLFEAFVNGRELECSILGNDEAMASNPAEIVISPDYEFYTYEAKYLDPNAVELKVPAQLDQETAERIRELSLKAYQALGCEDFARVDLFLTVDGEILINEINTIPGFTNSSMFPMMWKERGISYKDLLTKIIDLAFERRNKLKNISNEFTGA